MRLIVTGMNDGKASLVREVALAGAGDTFSSTNLLDLVLAELPPRPPGRTGVLDLKVAAGHMRWVHINFAADQEAPMHCTDSLDCHTIVAGSIDLLLDDGAHRLVSGDCAIVGGVDHGWRAGPAGCTSSLLIFGTPPGEG